MTAAFGLMYCTKYYCMPFWILFYGRIRPLIEALPTDVVRSSDHGFDTTGLSPAAVPVYGQGVGISSHDMRSASPKPD